ncbi:MAG: hypothetical protein B6I36_04250 [Desulfobacteraceae bacterium 4572_35.1]|nr:MAG: hypothetical protein B6I36_04250 [Desulfobacteraceae bacterium 4572_35.1]
MPAARRLILLPGIAADERSYCSLGDLPIEVLTPRLLVPRWHESMEDYAARHANWLKVGDLDIVGGCSFGSMVAGEICRQRSVSALVLLSGALSSASLSPLAHKLKTISTFIPLMLARPLLLSSPFLRAVFGASSADNVKLARQMALDTPAQLIVRGRQLATNYYPNQPLHCPVFALHGVQDRVILPPAVEHCELIDDAGHGMIVTHPQRVSSFLLEILHTID